MIQALISRLTRLLHGFSSRNEFLLDVSETCGCFYCEKIYDPDEIYDWIVEYNSPSTDRTAMCPYCGIDSVIPDIKVHLSKELLRAMHERWFS